MNKRSLVLYFYFIIILMCSPRTNAQTSDLDKLYQKNREEVADVLQY